MTSTEQYLPDTNGTYDTAIELRGRADENYPPKQPSKEANGLNANFQGQNQQQGALADDPEAGQEEEYDEWEDSDDEEVNLTVTVYPLAFLILFLQQSVKGIYKFSMRETRGYLIAIIFCILYTIYFIASMIYKFGDEGSIRLLVCTILGVLIATRHMSFYVMKKLKDTVLTPDRMSSQMQTYFRRFRVVVRWLMYGVLLAYTVYILVDELQDGISNGQGLPGFCIFILICLGLSSRPHMINWHTIVWSIGLQFLFAVFTLRYRFGRDVMEYVQDRINEFFAKAENAFITVVGPNYLTMGLAFSSLPLAFMVSAALTVLYFLGAMQFFVSVLGKIFKFIMDTAYVESLSVAFGIFLDGPLAIIAMRPYLSSQSKSQLFTIMLSTISSLGATTLAIFAGFGIPVRHIVAAMLISAPATFTVAKLLIPERKYKGSKDDHSDAKIKDEEHYANILDAFQVGSVLAIPLAANVIAIVFAFLCGIEWISSTLVWFGDRIGEHNLTLDRALSYIMYPIALAMGIDKSECLRAGRLIGVKLFSSGLIAFLQMREQVVNRGTYFQYLNSTIAPEITHKDGGILLGDGTFLRNGYISERTETILTYGLCGLSSFLSVSITVASMYAFLPHRRSWLAKMAPIAVIGGNVSCFMTGCLAGIFYEVY